MWPPSRPVRVMNPLIEWKASNITSHIYRNRELYGISSHRLTSLSIREHKRTILIWDVYRAINLHSLMRGISINSALWVTTARWRLTITLPTVKLKTCWASRPTCHDRYSTKIRNCLKYRSARRYNKSIESKMELGSITRYCRLLIGQRLISTHELAATLCPKYNSSRSSRKFKLAILILPMTRMSKQCKQWP